jgi:gluconolactonase
MKASHQKHLLKKVSFKKSLISVLLLSASGIAVNNAWAEDYTAATLVTPAIPGIVAGGIELRPIKDGFAGTEGPVALPDGSVIFTETQANRITKINQDGSTTNFISNSNGANGLGFSANGDLYAAQTLKPSVGIIYPANRARVLADKFEGKPLNRPNDLVVDKKGGVYFTDPGVAPKPNEASTTQPAVYYIKPSGELTRVITDITRPNGIQLSPDETVLYVANTAGEYVFAYDVAEDGSIGERRKFALLEGFRKTENGPSSGADGLAVDAVGRLYVATSVGIQVFNSDGIALGIIQLPKAPQNLAFSGPDKKTLYVVGRGEAYTIPVITAGYVGRAK